MFRGALLADAVGLGKTFVTLAVAGHYDQVTAVVPSSIVTQWHRASASVNVRIEVVSTEALSRGTTVPPAELLVVDEAHRFRNPHTRRYDTLARGIGGADVLLITATPIVNHSADLVHLLRLFLADNTLAFLGVNSLEQAAVENRHAELVHAIAPLFVARSVDSVPSLRHQIPRTTDGVVLRPPPVPTIILERLVQLIDRLEFASVAGEGTSTLLRHHLLHRLASSAPALVQTARRHLQYVDRAIAACARGEHYSRPDLARLVTTHDELQLDLTDLLSTSSDTPLQTRNLECERRILVAIIDAIASVDRPSSPKAARLRQLLAGRSSKTVVFVTALATAFEVAAELGWRELAVVGNGTAWIASGHIPVQEALSLFAPDARRAPPPSRALKTRYLIATDFASEGLNLQDANGVVHYDLPWTPLRLAQRHGRVARLGSRHHEVAVWWFAPPRVLARAMRIETRLATKVTTQLGLGVACTSRVGHAHVTNQMLSWSDRAAGEDSTAVGVVGHSVVKGPQFAGFAVRWQIGSATVPELIVVAGETYRQVSDPAVIRTAFDAFARGSKLHLEPPCEAERALTTILRGRLASAQRGPVNPVARMFVRNVLRRARAAATMRSRDELELLDSVLDRLGYGVPVGAERELATALESGSLERLKRWMAKVRNSKPAEPQFHLAAAVFCCAGGENEIDGGNR